MSKVLIIAEAVSIITETFKTAMELIKAASDSERGKISDFKTDKNSEFKG